MSRVTAHEEIGLRTELIVIVRKTEMHVPLGLPLTLLVPRSMRPAGFSTSELSSPSGRP